MKNIDIEKLFKDIISYGEMGEPKNTYIYDDETLIKLCNYIESQGYIENKNISDEIGFIIFMDKRANKDYLDGNVIWISSGSKYIDGNYAYSMSYKKFLHHFEKELSFNPLNDIVDCIKEWCYINDISKKDSIININELTGGDIIFKVNYDINIDDLKNYLDDSSVYDVIIEEEKGGSKGIFYTITIE